MKRILIAGANPYNANKGVAALAVSTIKIVHDIITEKDDRCEICVYNHEFTKTYDEIIMPDSSSISFQNIYPSDLFSLSNFCKTIFSRWRLYNLREFMKVDCVLGINAGDGFSDIYGEKTFFSITKVFRLCRLFRKPYCLLPQTYGPFYNEYIKKLAMKDCQYATIIMSRDSTSSEYVTTSLGAKHSLSTIDVAFCLPYKQMRHQHIGLRIGVNISQTLCFKDNNYKFHASDSYYDTMKRLVNSLLSKGYYVHLIPHVLNITNNNTNEYYISYCLWKELQHPNLRFSPFFLSPVDAKSYISSLDLFIGSRMHACIAAFSANVPVLLLGYSRKFSGLFSDTLDYHYVIEVSDNFSLERVEDKVNEMLSKLSEIKDLIEHTNQTVVKDKTNLIYDSLSNII